MWNQEISFNRNHRGPTYGRCHAPTANASLDYPASKRVIERTAQDCAVRSDFLLDLAVRRILASGVEWEDLTEHQRSQLSEWLKTRAENPERMKGFLSANH